MMTDYWLYVPEMDEAGCVAPGDSPEEALKNAEKVGWYPDPGSEVQCYELGAPHILYVPFSVEDQEEMESYQG